MWDTSEESKRIEKYIWNEFLCDSTFRLQTALSDHLRGENGSIMPHISRMEIHYRIYIIDGSHYYHRSSFLHIYEPIVSLFSINARLCRRTANRADKTSEDKVFLCSKEKKHYFLTLCCFNMFLFKFWRYSIHFFEAKVYYSLIFQF